MSYTTSADARKYVDYRAVSDLALRDDASEQLTESQVDSNANWLAALGAASGRLTAAVTMGGVYTTSQVAALTGDAQALRDRIVTVLALQIMVESRPDLDKAHPLPAAHQQAEMDLLFLRNAERIFG